MNTEYLLNRLYEIPQLIAHEQKDLLSKNRDFQEISNKILIVESGIRAQIAVAADSSGKKLYSNDDARKTAFIEHCQENLELSNLISDKTKISESMDLIKIDIELLSNEQRNIRTILSFTSQNTLN